MKHRIGINITIKMFSVKNGIQQTSKGNKHINATTNLSRLISYCCRSLCGRLITSNKVVTLSRQNDSAKCNKY